MLPYSMHARFCCTVDQIGVIQWIVREGMASCHGFWLTTMVENPGPECGIRSTGLLKSTLFLDTFTCIHIMK